MTVFIGDNIVSALGFTSEENYHNVKNGVSGLKFFSDDRYDLPEPFMASKIDDERLEDAFENNLSEKGCPPVCGIKYSKMEKACIVSITESLKNTNIDPSIFDICFIEIF